MMSLLVFKERLKRIYSKYEIYITPVLKLIIGISAFFMMNSNIGFMTKLKNPAIPIILGLMCSFLPYSAIVFITAVFLILHIFSVSFEIALLIIILSLIVGMLYYGFHPGNSIILVLTPMLFLLKIPYVIPLIMGLTGTVASIIPVSFGVCIYYIISYVKQNAGILTNESSAVNTQKYTQILDSLLVNRIMLLTIAAFSVTILIVYLIRRLSVNYAWSIAIGAGAITQLVILLIGDFAFDVSISIFELLIGIALSTGIAALLNFFVFAVDYSRTEYVQFEDDDYYYYVKAVPKIIVTTPDIRVQRINARRTRRIARESSGENSHARR